MIVYMNFSEVRGPYGGANAFLATLRRDLTLRGVTVTADPSASFDVALLNALTNDIDVRFVDRLAKRGAPIVHRKVGYRVSGSPELRQRIGGVVWGDKLQLDFSPYVAHTIFQSRYSRDVFLESGFAGDYTVIHNGVDDEIFNVVLARGPLRPERPRVWWDGVEPLRVVISTWSTDENKGFPDYREIDEQVRGRDDVRVELIGRLPAGTRFRAIRVRRPLRLRKLAERLKRAHVLLQLARWETCSNALIEGINCGLPPIYLDSGSNAELAAPYGVRYDGDFLAAVGELIPRYHELVARIPENPYRISLIGARYCELLETVATRRPVPA